MTKTEKLIVEKLIEYGFKVQVQDAGPLLPALIWAEMAVIGDGAVGGHVIWFKCNNGSTGVTEGYATETIANYEKLKKTMDELWNNIRITDFPCRNYLGDNP